MRDISKGISSYWKIIFKNQLFSCICSGSFFFFLGKIYWNELLRLGIECSLSCSFLIYLFGYRCIYFLSQKPWAIFYFSLMKLALFSFQL